MGDEIRNKDIQDKVEVNSAVEKMSEVRLRWFEYVKMRRCPIEELRAYQKHPLHLRETGGCLIVLILALGWALAAYVIRGREIRRMKSSMKSGNSFAFLTLDINELEHSNQANLPRVTVVMPLKGFGEHNLHNWRSQITSLYGGPLEFLFVVESTADPAYHADAVEAKVIVAGLSTTCSQKIHNQLVGVDQMHKDTKYVLFLDDDVRLHPGSIGALTTEMEKNPDIFIQTGYPLDLPSGTLGSYCIYGYHMPCSMGFATGGKTFFLWGGCMMMHANDFRTDRHFVVSGLRDGGYSDDMTLAAIAGKVYLQFLIPKYILRHKSCNAAGAYPPRCCCDSRNSWKTEF
ncbi:hypothetical protein KY284_012437 [Solanum tuberosum]|nr:hypothetical protein KY284_012436 [Solanum tuberosum]KAH0711010.1 hypothetical protein KY284_012437 [Solanum tuberosum]